MLPPFEKCKDLLEMLKLLQQSMGLFNQSGQPSAEYDLTDQSLAQKLFVNFELFPSFAQGSNKSMATLIESSDYSEQLSHALMLWAQYAEKSLEAFHKGFWFAASAWLYASKAYKMLNFLDSKTNAPKIIDENTYQIALILQAFFEAVSSEAALSQMPESLRERLTTKRQEMQAVLSHRLANYQAHRPESLRFVMNTLQQRQERKNLLDVEFNKMLDILREFKAKMASVSHDLSMISLLSHAPGQRFLDELDCFYQKYHEHKNHLLKYLEDWSLINNELNLPDAVKTSKLIDFLLLNDFEQARNEWLMLYNTDSLLVTNEPVLEYLNTESLLHKKQLIELDDHLKQDLSNLKQGIQQFIDDSQLFHRFSSQLSQVVTDSQIIKPPASVLVLLTSNPIHWPTDHKQFKALCEQMFQYKKDLLSHKKAIEEQVKALPSTASAFNINNRSSASVFQEQLEKTRQVLESNRLEVGNAIKTLTVLIEQESSQWHHMAFETEKNDIETLEKNLQEAQQHVLKATEVLVQYECRMEKELECLDDLSRLNGLIGPAEKRQGFLHAALKQLIDYKDIIIHHKGIYIPVHCIDKEQLIMALEASKSQIKTINTLYSKAIDAGRFRGMNWTHWTSQWQHVTTFFGPSDSELEINTLLDWIDHQMALIQQELKVKIPLLNEKQKPSAGYLSDQESLYAIKTRYCQLMSALSVKKTALFQLDIVQYQPNSQLLLLAQEAPRNAAIINDRRIDLLIEQKIHQLALDLSKCELLINKFKRLFPTLETRVCLLDETLIHLDNLSSSSEAVEYIKTLSDVMRDGSFNYPPSQEVDALEQQHTDLKNKIQSILSQWSASLSQEKKAYVHSLCSQIEELSTQKIKVSQQFDRLRKKLADQTAVIVSKQNLWLCLNKLELMRASKDSLFQQISIKTDQIQTKKECVMAVDQFNLNHQPLNFSPHDLSDPRVVHLSSEIQALDDKIRARYLQLRIDYILEEQVWIINAAQQQKSIEAKKSLLRQIQKVVSEETVFIQANYPLESKRLEDLQTLKVKLSGEINQKNQASQSMDELLIEYFGEQYPIDGVFGDYLEERKEIFWFKDLLSEMVALTLQCFGYKTDSQSREDYLNLLHKKLIAFKDNKDCGTDVQDISQCIHQGLIQFKPRAIEGNRQYENSLHSKLKQLQSSLNQELKNTDSEPCESEINCASL